MPKESKAFKRRIRAEAIRDCFLQCGTQQAVADRFGLTRGRISQILSEGTARGWFARPRPLPPLSKTEIVELLGQHGCVSAAARAQGCAASTFHKWTVALNMSHAEIEHACGGFRRAARLTKMREIEAEYRDLCTRLGHAPSGGEFAKSIGLSLYHRIAYYFGDFRGFRAQFVREFDEYPRAKKSAAPSSMYRTD